MGAGGGWAVAAQGITDIGKTVASGVAQLQAQKFTKKMMKNRFQWMVNDLRAAGLNPILAVRGFGPGIGPSGIAGVGGGGGSIGSTALSSMKLKSELEIMRRQAESLASNALQARSQAALNLARIPKVTLEVEEFRPTLGGIGRRMLRSKEAQKVFEAVSGAPDWIKDRLRSVADRWRK